MEKTHTCDTCGSSYKHHFNLLRHQRTAHGGESYPCQQCGVRFTQKSDLSRHLTRKHESQGLTCTICERIFSRKDTLVKHMETCTIRRPCPRCERKFKSEEELTSHMSLCPVPSCAECGVQFAFRSHLQEHMKTHPKSKRVATSESTSSKRRKRLTAFHCTVCNSSFEERQQLF